MLGFQIYSSISQFQKAQVIGDRYVIRNYPHTSLYGTPGRKEAYIVAPASNGFIPNEHGIAEIIVEAKHQSTSGSTDEKPPHVWEAFLVSPVPNWIVIFDGPYWKSTGRFEKGRGKLGVAWLQARAEARTPENRRLVVIDRMGFIRLATETWGAQ